MSPSLSPALCPTTCLNSWADKTRTGNGSMAMTFVFLVSWPVFFCSFLYSCLLLCHLSPVVAICALPVWPGSGGRQGQGQETGHHHGSWRQDMASIMHEQEEEAMPPLVQGRRTKTRKTVNKMSSGRTGNRNDPPPLLPPAHLTLLLPCIDSVSVRHLHARQHLLGLSLNLKNHR